MPESYSPVFRKVIARLSDTGFGVRKGGGGMDGSMDSGGSVAMNWCPNTAVPGDDLGAGAGNGGESCSRHDTGDSSFQVEKREIILITNQPPRLIELPFFRNDDDGADYLLKCLRVTCAKKDLFPAVEYGWLRRDCVKCFSGIGRERQKKFIRKLVEERHAVELSNYNQVQWLRPRPFSVEEMMSPF